MLRISTRCLRVTNLDAARFSANPTGSEMEREGLAKTMWQYLPMLTCTSEREDGLCLVYMHRVGADTHLSTLRPECGKGESSAESNFWLHGRKMHDSNTVARSFLELIDQVDLSPSNTGTSLNVSVL